MSISLVVYFLSALCYSRAALDQNENCETWAAVDLECSRNPSYMWDACQKSCISFAKNNHEECAEWASTGECTNNLRFMHLNCPEACENAAGWNPWVRRELDLRPIQQVTVADNPCGVRRDVLGAAETVHNRVAIFLSGSRVDGLTDSAPSEFNGMAGLAEAVLYSARLYQSILEKADSTASTTLGDLIEEVSQVLSRYDGDAVMRSLRSWVQALDKASSAVYDLSDVDRDSPEGTCLAFGPSMEEVAAHFLPSYRALTSTAPVDSAQPQAQSVGSVVLSNGVVMPTVGLGTWQLEGEECARAVREAIRAGYRHFDSAQAYGNEAEIGSAITEAIAAGTVTREELFLATKISDEGDAGTDGIQRLVQEQLAAFQTHYIDLYMLHSPIADAQVQDDTWRALEVLVDAGVIKALGVSNFAGDELEALYNFARIKPVVVQNKFDVYHVGKQIDPNGDDIEETCRHLGVKIVAYSPFSAYPFAMLPTADPIVQYVAEKNNCTPAQAILRWVLQRGALVIPRSTSPMRLAENMAVVNMPALSTTDFALMSTITYLTASAMYVATS